MDVVVEKKDGSRSSSSSSSRQSSKFASNISVLSYPYFFVVVVDVVVSFVANDLEEQDFIRVVVVS